MSDPSRTDLLEKIQLLALRVSSSNSTSSAALAQEILRTTRTLEGTSRIAIGEPNVVVEPEDLGGVEARPIKKPKPSVGL